MQGFDFQRAVIDYTLFNEATYARYDTYVETSTEVSKQIHFLSNIYGRSKRQKTANRTEMIVEALPEACIVRAKLPL